MTKAHRILLVIFSLTIAFTALSAAITQYYAFNESQSYWEPVWGNYINEAMQDEGLSDPIDIGFSFPYAGSSFTQVKVSSNGWLNLGTNLTLPYYGNDLSYLNIRPIIAPLWDDLSLEVGSVVSATVGTAPYRIFYMQWQAAKWNYNAVNQYYFMVRMHEYGLIDFLYGPGIDLPGNPSASIGMNMAPGGSGNYFSILPGAPATYSTTGSYNNVVSWPGSGTRYSFMPRTQLTANIAALNLYGAQTAYTVTDYIPTLTVGNAGTQPIIANTAVAYLLNGEDILDIKTVPAINPGNFAEVTFNWNPDIAAQLSLKAKVVLANDADSLNDVTMPISVTITDVIGNSDDVASIPEISLQAGPNPFHDKVSVSYELKQSVQVKLEVFNLKGQKVCVLQDEVKSAGLHSAEWNGRNDGGKAVPEGIYFLRLNTGKSQVSKKLILLK